MLCKYRWGLVNAAFCEVWRNRQGWIFISLLYPMTMSENNGGNRPMYQFMFYTVSNYGYSDNLCNVLLDATLLCSVCT